MPEVPNESKVIRPYYWSVLRELWENRSIYIAPLIVTAVVLFGYLLSMIHFPERRRNALLLDEVHRRAAIAMPFGAAGMMIMMTGIIVGVFYCLDALHAERRDRSVLFWKSLPVSDLTTVLAKVSIPILVLPLLSFVIIVPTQLVMLLVSSVVLLMNDLSPAVTWTNFPLPFESVVLLYGLLAMTLWYVPIYGYFLLVSGWVRRATFLWAVLPFIALLIFERVTFGTAYFYLFLKHRITGFAPDAFDFQGQETPGINSLSQLTPGRYLATPGLWLGLIFAAACIAAAVRLRRYRGPI